MAGVYVHGAPGLPDSALDTSTVEAFVDRSPTSDKDGGLKRSYDAYLATDSDMDTHISLKDGIKFTPREHLGYQPPEKIYTMEDLALPPGNGVSPMAVSEPFPLFTVDAVDKMRAEVLSDVVLENFSYTSDIAPKQLRGFAPKHAKFVAEAWKNAKTLEIVSRIAGIDLVPVIDYEIGHINISIPGPVVKDFAGGFTAKNDSKAVVDWHRDSYPFVCVLMMSDTTGMIGGETALKTGDGRIMKVRGPTKGCAVVLQGRYIEHQALRAFGSRERITMVTSFRPRSPLVRDDTILNTVRPISNLPDLYGQVVEYQLENMEARLRGYLKSVRESMKVGSFDVKTFKEWAAFEKHALNYIDKEIVEEHKVRKGILSDAIEAEREAVMVATGGTVKCV